MNNNGIEPTPALRAKIARDSLGTESRNEAGRTVIRNPCEESEFCQSQGNSRQGRLACPFPYTSETLPRLPNFQQRLNGAQTRLAHVETEYAASLTKLKALLGQLGTRYDRNDPFDPSKGLAMIRRDVNSRKHSVYKRSEVLDALPRPASGTVKWSDAGCNSQMETAVASLDLVVGAYSELLAWYPVAKF
jgi:hypothetical protein